MRGKSSRLLFTAMIVLGLIFSFTAGPVSAARPGDDGPVLDVQLAPGWGAALLVLDASRVLGYSRSGMDNGVPMRGLEGARIVAGGRTLGISDAHGLALCASDAPIEAFEVLLPGWSRLSVRGFLGHARTPNGLGFVLMIRD